MEGALEVTGEAAIALEHLANQSAVQLNAVRTEKECQCVLMSSLLMTGLQHLNQILVLVKRR